MAYKTKKNEKQRNITNEVTIGMPYMMRMNQMFKTMCN